MKRIAASLAIVVAVAAGAGGAHAASAVSSRECQRDMLGPLWTRLDTARAYRGGFAEQESITCDLSADQCSTETSTCVANGRTCADNDDCGRCVGSGVGCSVDADCGVARKRGNKSYNQLLQDYPPQKLEFLSVLDGFARSLDDTRRRVRREAVCGFRETLNEIIAGEMLLGNQRLLQGLRTRYPGIGDPLDPDQLTLLNQSTEIFRDAVSLAADRFREAPERARSRGDVNPDFPFFVQNTPAVPGTQGEVVESDYFRFTDLVVRYGLAGNSLGKRMFFFGNDDPVERANAAAVFQRTAQTVYLTGALLGAAQSPDDFQNNNGFEVKRQVNDAQQIFDDILAGFNPLTLRGDFVPNQPTNNLLAGLRNLVLSAQAVEESARVLNRQYDEDQTALTQELRRQTESYVDQLDILLGLIVRPGDVSCDPPEQTACDLSNPQHREKVLALARDPVYMCGPQAAIDPLDCTATAGEGACDATICNFYRAYTGAQIELREAERMLMNFTEQIRVEEERAGVVTRTIQSGAYSLSALDVAQGLAVAATPDLAFDPSDLGAPELSFSVSAAVEGLFNSRRTKIEAAQEIQLEQNESAATIKNLLLEQITQSVAVERAKLSVIEENANYTASIGDLVRFIRNAAASREELTQAYFTNPAYRLQLELAQQDADAAFEAAMVSAYEATKALEYEWVERLANPVARQDGGLPEPIGGGAKFDPIVRAESVFAVASAGSPGSPSPTIQTYVESLQQWDSKMRQLRGPQRQPGQTVRISLKRDIFGLDSPDEAFNRIAFRDLIARNRVPGRNPSQDDLVLEFPIQIADETLLPPRSNLKVLNRREGAGLCEGGISVNLKTVPGRMLRSTPSPNPPLVDLVLLDEAVLRTFFSRFESGGQDDFLTLKLERARDIGQSQFAALSVQATIDDVGTVQPNCQLANRSPAVSRWQFRIPGGSGSNGTLLLDNLDDIELILTYTFGQPPTFEFPVFPR